MDITICAVDRPPITYPELRNDLPSKQGNRSLPGIMIGHPVPLSSHGARPIPRKRGHASDTGVPTARALRLPLALAFPGDLSFGWRRFPASLMRETDGDPRYPSHRNGSRRMSAPPFRASAIMAGVDRRSDSIDAIRTVVQLAQDAVPANAVAPITSPARRSTWMAAGTPESQQAIRLRPPSSGPNPSGLNAASRPGISR